MFDTVLIANRGEIACRIIKTLRRLHVQSVAVYSRADEDSLHVKLADKAFYIGEAPTSESYLNMDAIIHAAILSNAQAIHPGYGFLSENPEFARRCIAAGIVFIGPSIDALECMGSKQLAKQRLEQTEVPLTPGYHGIDQSDERLLSECEHLGFPVLLKAANGGGGKGMREVQSAHEFDEALAGARREALAYFADETLIIEKRITNARHIEVQLMADHHGTILHLFERDCSIQRRHQKIIEEAPATNLSESVRSQLANAAIAVAKAIDYRGAGTIEFLVDEYEQFYFMEMNTRLQVEHPVTELITGVDLVEWQLRIAANEALSSFAHAITARGHAIECRIYAEDPAKHFMPSTGCIDALTIPLDEGIRIDSGVTKGSHISIYYDPMIAKLIAWGEDRTQALCRLERALSEYHISGIKTNIPFLQAILHHPIFVQAQFTTDFLSQNPIEISQAEPVFALHVAACADFLATVPQDEGLGIATFAWQLSGHRYWDELYEIDTRPYRVRITAISANELTLTIEGLTKHYRITRIDNRLYLNDGQETRHALIEPNKHGYLVYYDTGCICVNKMQAAINTEPSKESAGQLTAPMPSTVVAILKNVGDTIKAGDRLMVLEAMKMEHAIYAPTDGIIMDIFYALGAQVQEGAQLLAVGKSES
jgi:3-methylcrotonyl-CoA carboxylase alpha subunit